MRLTTQQVVRKILLSAGVPASFLPQEPFHMISVYKRSDGGGVSYPAVIAELEAHNKSRYSNLDLGDRSTQIPDNQASHIQKALDEAGVPYLQEDLNVLYLAIHCPLGMASQHKKICEIFGEPDLRRFCLGVFHAPEDEGIVTICHVFREGRDLLTVPTLVSQSAFEDKWSEARKVLGTHVTAFDGSGLPPDVFKDGIWDEARKVIAQDYPTSSVLWDPLPN